MSSSPTDWVPADAMLDLARNDLAAFRRRRLGEMAVERGWVSKEQLDSCLQEQKSQTPGAVRLGGLLMARRLIQPDQLSELLKEQQTRDSSRFGMHDTPPIPPEVLEARTKPGQTLSKYILVKEIGRGGMGRIWKAWDPDLHRWVAVKILREEVAHPSARTRFMREARVAAGFRHPHLVTVHDFGEVGNQPFFVMELIDGTPLNLLGPRDENLRHFHKIALALEEAHRHGIVHRDLKPGNILIDTGGEPHVVDFGLAHLLDSDIGITQSGNVLGTPKYMAPEQVRGRKDEIGVRTDVHALGIMLYELLDGDTPYNGSTIAEVHEKVLREEPRPPRGTRDLVTICMKAIEKEPDRRYATAGAFAEDLRRYLNGEPIEARPAGWLYRFTKRTLKRKGILGLVAGAVLVGVLAALVVSANRSSRFLEARELGKAAFDTGQWETALGEFMKALDVRDDTEIRAWAARCREELEGIRAHREMMEHLDPLREKVNRLHRNLYTGGVDIEKAISEFLEDVPRRLDLLARKYPEFPEPQVLLGEAWFHLARLDRAETELKKVESAPKASFLLGRIYIRRAMEARMTTVTESAETKKKRWDEWRLRALEALDRFAVDEVEPIDRELTTAYKLYFAGEKEILIEHCNKALATYSGVAGVEEFWLLAAHNLPPVNRLPAYRKALEMRPHYVWGHFLLGSTYFSIGKYADAGRSYESALRIHPRMTPAAHGLALALARQGKPKEAIRQFETVVELDPNNAMVYYNRAIVYRFNNDIAKAIADYNRAIELNPRYTQALVNRGRLYRVTERTDQAYQDYDRAIEVDPTFAPAYLNRANLNFDLNRREDALGDYELVVKHAPNDPMSWFLRGRCRLALGDLDAAARDLKRALHLAPEGWKFRPDCEQMLRRAEQSF